jgi:hypothetical protein
MVDVLHGTETAIVLRKGQGACRAGGGQKEMSFHCQKKMCFVRAAKLAIYSELHEFRNQNEAMWTNIHAKGVSTFAVSGKEID